MSFARKVTELPPQLCDVRARKGRERQRIGVSVDVFRSVCRVCLSNSSDWRTIHVCLSSVFGLVVCACSSLSRVLVCVPPPFTHPSALQERGRGIWVHAGGSTCNADQPMNQAVLGLSAHPKRRAPRASDPRALCVAQPGQNVGSRVLELFGF